MPPLKLKLHKSFKLLEKEVEKKSIPGGILGGVNSEGERYIYCCGDAMITPKKKAMALSTWFDLASLTKVFFTTIEIINVWSPLKNRLGNSVIVDVTHILDLAFEEIVLDNH